MANLKTPFSLIYDSFLSKITDDMYMELTELDTYKMLYELLLSAIVKFEFPKKSLEFIEEYVAEEGEYTGVESNFVTVKALIYDGGYFINSLSLEEINIITTYMIVEWLGQQLASVENVRMKFTSAEFKMSSQANHMQKILQMKKDYEREGFHLQRLYCRRTENKKGQIVSTFGSIMFPDGDTR